MPDNSPYGGTLGPYRTMLNSKISKTTKLLHIQAYTSHTSEYPTGVHLTDVYLIGVCLRGVYLTGVHLINVHLTGVYLISMPLTGVYPMECIL
jgi:uncharacterized protein YjbI with pentapeptide repeats